MRVGSLSCADAQPPRGDAAPCRLNADGCRRLFNSGQGGARVVLDTSRGRILTTRVEGLVVRGAVQGSRSRRTVADPVARTGAAAARPVAGIGQPASVERETPAPDALGEPQLQALELGDALLDPRGPPARKPTPILARRRALRRKAGKLLTDLVERETDPLRENDERDPPEDRPPIPPMTGSGPLRLDETARLIEAQGR